MEGMRTTTRTIVRRAHWRWQRCGAGRSELRRVRVGETLVNLAPTDTRQLDLLSAGTASTAQRRSPRRTVRHGVQAAEPRPVLRSYWRRQPYGPQGELRKVILVDVHA